MSTEAASSNGQAEPYLISTSENDEGHEEELARLMELQRRQTEMLRPDIDNFVADSDLDADDVDDDFSVTASPHNKNSSTAHRPPLPEMRFAMQFEKSVVALQEKGASNMAIFWSAILKDQIILPFVSGFAFCIATSGWQWYRARGVINARQGKKGGLFRGIKEWTRRLYTNKAKTV